MIQVIHRGRSGAAKSAITSPDTPDIYLLFFSYATLIPPFYSFVSCACFSISRLSYFLLYTVVFCFGPVFAALTSPVDVEVVCVLFPGGQGIG